MPGEQTVAMFAARMKLTRVMLDLAAVPVAGFGYLSICSDTAQRRSAASGSSA